MSNRASSAAAATAGGGGGGSAQQKQQLKKEKVQIVLPFIQALKSSALALTKRRCEAVLLIQEEFRSYLHRAGSHIHVLRQERKVKRRNYILGVDKIIKAAVERGRSVCIEELKARQVIFLEHVDILLEDTVSDEYLRRKSVESEQEDDHEKMMEILLANVPRDIVPGTLEYDELQGRCHVAKLETYQRKLLVNMSITPRADIIHDIESNTRFGVAREEMEERIALFRQSRSDVAELQMLELERKSDAIRPQIEEERDIAVLGMIQHRALLSMFLLLGPGARSEHDARIDLYLDEEDEAMSIWDRMWDERTIIKSSILLAEEQKLRQSRRGIPAIEEHERCQIVTRLFDLRLLLLQGEFSSNDGLYVSSEAGSRRAIRWDEQRARNTIYQAAAATMFVALVPIEEARGRERIAHAEADQTSLMLQMLPGYCEFVLEPAHRRGMFRDWLHFAKKMTLDLFGVTLQALEESNRVFLRSAALIDLEFTAGSEYLYFLEMKHRQLILKRMETRSEFEKSFPSSSSSPPSSSSSSYYSPTSKNNNNNNNNNNNSNNNSGSRNSPSPSSPSSTVGRFPKAANSSSPEPAATSAAAFVVPPFVIQAAEKIASQSPSPNRKR